MAIISFLIFLLICINIIQLTLSNPGSDHFSHFGLINSIKANKHRFSSKVITYINESDCPDPQLYHWLLSLIPGKLLVKYYRFFGLFFNLISFCVFLFFIYNIFPFLPVTHSFDKFILLSGLFYILTPFEYFSWNAKNVGLSARGFGLLFGHCFVYSIVLYLYSGIQVYLISTILFSYIILLSSQFAFQFVLFFSIIVSFISGEVLLIVVPIATTLLLFLTFPKWAIVFFVRQWKYKKMYYNIFSEKFGLKARYSIWRDFIYDFWLAIPKRGVSRGLEYIYHNPVIEILLGFTALSVFSVFYLNNPEGLSLSGFSPILYSIAASIIVFIITSFRITRFLGEPQRYIEFIFPLIVLIPASVSDALIWIVIIVVSSFILAFELIIIKFYSRKKGGGHTTTEKTILLKDLFNTIEKKKEDNTLLSNNYEVLRFFSDKDYKILNVNVTSEFTGGIHFDEIFPETYGRFSFSSLTTLIRHYKIAWFILDLKMTQKEDFEKNIGVPVIQVASIYHFIIYKLC